MEGGPHGFPQGFSCLVVLWILSRFSASHTRLLRSVVPAFHPVILLACQSVDDSPQPRPAEAGRFGLFRFRSPLLAESRLISLPGATEMFQFAPSPSRWLWIHQRVARHLPWRGFPIRTSADCRIFSSSPQLFAACRVLLRLSVPRHSPCALSNLTFRQHPSGSCRFFGSLFLRRYPDTKMKHFSQRLAYPYLCLQDFVFFSLLPFLSFYLLSLSSLCSCQGAVASSRVANLKHQVSSLGGLKWTRTTDLALIRRTL